MLSELIQKTISNNLHELNIDDYISRKKNLEPNVWKRNDFLNEIVRENLIRIAGDFFSSLDLSTAEIIDISRTGSLSNYNWTKYSDLDLHIVIDFRQVLCDDNVCLTPQQRTFEFVKGYLKSKVILWNREHNIKIFGHEVEIYIQDVDEPHYSTGIYSVLKNKWIVKPSPKFRDVIDKENVKKKVKSAMDHIDGLEKLLKTKNYNSVIFGVEKFKDRLKTMRQAGLESKGEYSIENLTYKVLRNSKYLEKLNDMIKKSYDNLLSVNYNS